MKELIEYVLAALIIVSFIPIFDVIVTDFSTTNPPIIESSTLLYMSSGIRDVLNNISSQGNFTPQITDIAKAISSRLNLSREIGYNVRIVSSGISKVNVQDNNVQVYTTSPGKLTVCVVYDDLSYSNYTLDNPTTTLPNGTFLYTITTSRTNIIAVSAILETGVARYIGYWVSENIYEVYAYNVNNKITIAVPDTVPQPNYYTVSGSEAINAVLIYYTQGQFYNYSIVTGNFIVNLTWFQSGSNYYIGYGYYKQYLSRYVATYYDQATINGITYRLHRLQNYVEKDTHYIEYEYYAGSLATLYDIIVETSSHSFDIQYPIYNLVFIFLRDADGKIYYAIIYPHELLIGEPTPSNWVTYETTYTARIGMVNYDIIITVWRRFQG
ncbi:hypothetical protein [Staphylothermus hellenicus]|uniref:Uncharacterized protein n=1 Tax=Staphylothermus hellenicus (strain DSM 12710 / JCM 10830 / BK20S6-10-b1 / P8) TaxID=591019 RepID=D7D8I4_STAHD|nr:hypothetical protein [Staphylothermus hellenicus]ADI32080.1 hypothetical protein Shell_0974 [Staphylothermus hellenicus DSM 12710]